LVLTPFHQRPLQNYPPPKDHAAWKNGHLDMEGNFGKGPWAHLGEYRCPQEEPEAGKAARKHYEELAWLARKPERQPQK
jgi:hypothetical protein